MRLQRIAIRNFRGVDSSEVTFATEGVTIVEGDNETGKTSLAERLAQRFGEPWSREFAREFWDTHAG